MRQILLPDDSKYKIKTDRYQKERGAVKVLDVCCAACGNLVMVYQKDGPGPLKRCYLDRIAWPAEYTQLAITAKDKSDLIPITCDKCQNLIATPMVYKKEKRLAYLMLEGAYTKSERTA